MILNRGRGDSDVPTSSIDPDLKKETPKLK